MKASIIITTYKRSALLFRAIESCLNQHFDDELEIIVVDDNGKGSDWQEKNEKELSLLINQGKIRYIIHELNRGGCAARNTGAENAVGDYLFFLDDDDEFHPDKVRKQVSFLEENKEYDAHASAFVKKRNNEFVPAKDNLPVIGDLKDFLMYGNFYTLMLCIRKSTYLEIGGFREIPKYQDMYFMCYFLAANKKIYSSEEPLFVITEHSEERISNKSARNSQLAAILLKEFVNKYKNLFNNKEWKLVNARLNLLVATTYYSSNYINRLRSIKFWLKVYSYSKNKNYLQPVIKAFIPNPFIKKLEKIKYRYYKSY